jgi:cellulose synthase/poly-beta-1,6-N-acetylglucosamine synthase-like glycosyltransferase
MAIDLLLVLLAVPALLWSVYLAALTLLSWRLTPPPAPADAANRFAIVVPAHNEAAVIERTVASLLQVDWPKALYRVIVVADNCTDATAEIAAKAGASVWQREDLSLRGKGYALDFAFGRLLAEGWADAIVVVDADTTVSPNLLQAFAAHLSTGVQAVQVEYGILNPHSSWRTQLMTIAMAAFHIVRSRTRERLGLSSGIRGNGWCLASDVLRHVPYRAFSLAEDLEYGIALGLAGYRVAYADEAQVLGEMVSSAQIAERQRQRWEGGRFALIRTQTLPLLRDAVLRRSAVSLDLALDLLLLPLSYVAATIGLLLAASALLGPYARFGTAWLALALACALVLVAHVMRGWQLSGLGARGLITLARVPSFLIWKLLIAFRPRSSEWIRTDRERREK